MQNDRWMAIFLKLSCLLICILLCSAILGFSCLLICPIYSAEYPLQLIFICHCVCLAGRLGIMPFWDGVFEYYPSGRKWTLKSPRTFPMSSEIFDLNGIPIEPISFFYFLILVVEAIFLDWISVNNHLCAVRLEVSAVIWQDSWIKRNVFTISCSAVTQKREFCGLLATLVRKGSGIVMLPGDFNTSLGGISTQGLV